MSEDLTRAELRRIADEFQSERDAAKGDAMRAFDERNVAHAENAALRTRVEALERALRCVIAGNDALSSYVVIQTPSCGFAFIAPMNSGIADAAIASWLPLRDAALQPSQPKEPK